MDTIPTYEAVLKQMNSMEFSGMKLGLERIRKALKLLGNPEKKLKIIHVTGTNGKGSVSAMVSTILVKAGYDVGMFTSPHLVDVRERIQLNNRMISEDDFRKVFLEAQSTFTELTFFETITLMAVLYFVKKKVDYAVFEVGLGGRLDATNFETSLISVITSISLDHTGILGNTVEEIAEDKCGIIKRNQAVVTTRANEKVIEIIKENVRINNSRLIIADMCEYETSLKGQFQKENAGIAVAVARELGISDSLIKKALLEVYWPGRIEFFEKNVLFDCAHNPSGITALSKYLKTLDYEKLIFVFGVSKNKDYKEMIRLLPEYDEFIFTESDTIRQLLAEELDLECTKIKDPVNAVEYAKKISGEKDLIVVCGSIFLIGRMKERLKPVLTPAVNNPVA